MVPTIPDDLPAHVETVVRDFVATCRKNLAERLSSIVLFGTAAEGRLRATSDVNIIVVLREYRQKDVAGPLRTCAATLLRLESGETSPPKEALEHLVNAAGRPELDAAIRNMSQVREHRQPSGADLTASFFVVLEIIGAVRVRAWSLT